jgi:membrane associated rhomboid family serine protease
VRWYTVPVPAHALDDVPARLLDLPATSLLIGSVLVVSLWGWIFKPVQRWMILNPYLVRTNGEIHRLATAGWVHANLWHLGFNMLALYFFAGEATRVLGTPRFLFLYLSAVVVAFIPTTLRYMRDPGYNTLGASGAVAAVMFSAILLQPKLRLYVMLVPLPVPAVVFAAGYLAYSLWHSMSAGDHVNHDAHLSGALYGSLLTYFFEPARVERSLRILLRFIDALRR